MIVSKSTTTNWIELTHQLGVNFEKRASAYDKEGAFVHDNYEELKKHGFFSAAIPEELGGGGISHEEMCNVIRNMAQYCSSTALAFSMHQHLIAASLWKLKHKNVGATMLQNVAKHQLVLISTGAADWLGSSGELTKVEGGYLFTGKKHFASQSVAGNVVVTSARYLNEKNNWQVLHFSASMNTEGISIIEDWNVLGMRSTGSQTIEFKAVFIPDTSISLERSKDEFHMIWHIVLTVALPLIMATYVGIAEKAMHLTIEKSKTSKRNQNHTATMIGKLNNTLLSIQTQWRAMYGMTNNFDFKPNEAISINALSYKTNIAEGAKQVVTEAMVMVGGHSFYKKNNLERLFRDVQAGEFHPLPKWDQYAFTGERLLK